METQNKKACFLPKHCFLDYWLHLAIKATACKWQARGCTEYFAKSKDVALDLLGDDIDREIAKKILLPQLVKGKNPADVFYSADLENTVLPRLKPAAEIMKIQCCQIIETKQLSLDCLLYTSDAADE